MANGGLRTVHLIFVTACVLLAAFVAAWAMERYRHAPSAALALASALSLVVAVALAVYGLVFRRKSRYW